jgi:DNA-binding transcriptional regulator LsrR (DeoR family)
MGLAEQVRCVYAAMRRIRWERSTVDMAEELGVSRLMVGRMIRRVRDEGLVDLRPRMFDRIHAELSNALARRFGLRSAFVITTPLKDRKPRMKHGTSSIAEPLPVPHRASALLFDRRRNVDGRQGSDLR